MRASLAALGIFIGTSTVIWLVAMGEGVSYQAQQQILELGATNIIVRTKEPSLDSDGQDANSRVKIYGLLRDDYRRIVENIPSIRRALGATRQHIIQQFLTETVVLTASGGLLGVLFGLLCGLTPA